MKKWKIWYVDTEYEGSTIEEWLALPDEGVVAILEWEGWYKEFLLTRHVSGSDWYWVDENETICAAPDTADEPGIWVPYPGPETNTIKKGKWVSNERMSQVEQELMEISLTKREV